MLFGGNSNRVRSGNIGASNNGAEREDDVSVGQNRRKRHHSTHPTDMDVSSDKLSILSKSEVGDDSDDDYYEKDDDYYYGFLKAQRPYSKRVIFIFCYAEIQEQQNHSCYPMYTNWLLEGCTLPGKDPPLV